MDTPIIKTATPSQEKQIVDLIVLAFSTQPLVRWIHSAPHQYLQNFPVYVEAVARTSIAQGGAFYVDGFLGACLWLPPNVQLDSDSTSERTKRIVSEDIQQDLLPLLNQLSTFRPIEPHWHLSMIGVDPAHQSRGIGSALLNHALTKCDLERLPAHLETSSPKNLHLYERHGFNLLGTAQSGSSPTVNAMLRNPR